MPTTPSTSKPRIVIVLGMHRSGTSVTMNVLNALGLPLSDDLMPPTQFNQKGYFESWTISKIHDDILRAFGLTWAMPTTVRPLPPQWWLSPAVAQSRRQLVELVSREFEKAGHIWGFKDPRTARLLPLWTGIIDELGLDPAYVLVSRHPRDCGRSLQTREGMHPVQAELLWLEHTADAVASTSGKLDAIVEYDRWFDDGMAQAEYLIEKLRLAHPGADRLSEMLAGIVSGDLRHSRTTEALYELPFTSEFNDAVHKRDVERLDLLSNLFTATKRFSQTVIALCTQELVARANESARIANERGAELAKVQGELKAAQSAPVKHVPIDRSPAAEVRARKLTYLAPERLHSIYDCVDSVISAGVPGDFAEFGVALGGSGVCLAKALDGGRRYFGFDVFGMIPPPTEMDGARVRERYKVVASGQSHGIEGERYYGYVENLYDVVSGTFASFGFPPGDGRVQLVRGLFNETLPQHENLRLAIAHLDCDWYEPVAYCLKFVWPRLSPGGFVVIDDYNDWEGCRKATDEFVASTPGVAFVRKQPHAVLKKT